MNIKYVLIVTINLSETLLILRRIERDIIIYVYWYSCKVPVILVRFERNLISLNGFSKSTNFMRILPVGAELFHEKKGTDIQT